MFSPYQASTNPLWTDPRPIRTLSNVEQIAILLFIKHRLYAAVDGFESWRGQDRWYYITVLGVGRNVHEAEEKGMPVGPITTDWLNDLRMVGDQLSVRVMNPWGEVNGRFPR